jgi:hypothetical protein
MMVRPRAGRFVFGPALVILAFALGLAAPAAAAVPPQQSGGAPGGLYNWYELPAGQSAEWIFNYTGSNNAALVAFGEDPANSIAVKVYDDGQWKSLGEGNRSIKPVGQGTPGTAGAWPNNQDLIKAGQLFWEAGARPAVTFHIQVNNTTQAPARYWIASAGPGAGGLTPNFLVTSAATAAATAGAAPTSQAAGTQGQGSAAAPAAGAQATTGRTAAQGAPPPETLPVSGADGLLPVLAAGLGSLAIGWQLRRRAAR